MASRRDRRIKGASQTTNMREEISVKKEFHVPPLSVTTKESTKKRKDPTKEKKKSGNGINQSRDSEKLQWTNGEMSDVQSKGQAKAKERKSSKPKNPKGVSEAVPTQEDSSDLTPLEQDSLRWEGALEDPTAEAQRLEVYRANRRKRYMASRQAFLQNIQNSNSSKLNTRNKPGVIA
ncbi:protein LIAT1 [Sinocyclocheilus grahami]|uniref:protein LIAT1 n=1 Tax=Sinocyclocheilus grahami TaxID=75366 RepID=UPI0007ACB899|nr:PREDICTED: protein LIAT1 [Sinocyclocheilus grahami]